MKRKLVCGLVLLATGCGDAPAVETPVVDETQEAAPPVEPDPPWPHASNASNEAMPQEVDPRVIVAPPETWTYVDFPTSMCGNGKSTGLAVNLSQKSSRAVIFLEGGGACWDVASCFVLKSAANIETTMGQAAVLAGAHNVPFVFDRTNPNNPFRDVSFVYVPYCTGDLHFGTMARVYDVLGVKKTVNHVGAKNVDAYLDRLVPTFADADRVWLMGASAGGFGATLNAKRVQDAFSEVRVDVIDDGGPMTDPVAGRWQTWMKTWGATFPSGCTGCDTSPRNVMLFNESLPGSYALGSYANDLVISFYFGIGADQLEWGTRAMMAKMGPTQKAFLAAGTSHVLLNQPNTTTKGVVYSTWLQELVNDDPNWKSVAP